MIYRGHGPQVDDMLTGLTLTIQVDDHDLINNSGPLGDHFGTILGELWDHFGVTLGPFWDHFKIIWGSFWDHFGVIWRSFGGHSGIIFWNLVLEP